MSNSKEGSAGNESRYGAEKYRALEATVWTLAFTQRWGSFGEFWAQEWHDLILASYRIILATMVRIDVRGQGRSWQTCWEPLEWFSHSGGDGGSGQCDCGHCGGSSQTLVVYFKVSRAGRICWQSSCVWGLAESRITARRVSWTALCIKILISVNLHSQWRLVESKYCHQVVVFRSFGHLEISN